MEKSEVKNLGIDVKLHIGGIIMMMEWGVAGE